MDNSDSLVNFSLEIENLVSSKGLSYIESVIFFCEQRDIEVETVSKMISGTLKAKIGLEANNLNLLKKPVTESIPLPI